MRTLLATAIAVAVPASLANGALLYYDNQAAFETAMSNAGNVLDFVETFEENTGDPANVFTLDPVLTFGVPNGVFPTGLDAPNLTVTTQGATELVLLTENFLSNPSDIVGPNTFAENGVLQFSGDMVGVGFDLWILANNGGSMGVQIYDVAGALLDEIVISTPGELSYFGVQSTSDAIGSIITFDAVGDSAGELFDNVAMYTVPSPGAIALLGLAGLAGRRRRLA